MSCGIKRMIEMNSITLLFQ